MQWKRTFTVAYFIIYRAFSDDVTAAILVFQNNDTTAMLVCQPDPMGAELFSLVNTFFCSNKFAWLPEHVSETLYMRFSKEKNE